MFKNSSNLYDSEWLAIVFTNRNQQYGAYTLRRQSSRMLFKAFLITAPIFVAAFVGPSILSALKGNQIVNADPIVDKVVEFDNVIHEIKPKEEPKPTAVKTEVEAPKVIPLKAKTVSMSSNIKVVPDNLVVLQPPTSDELKNAIIASTTQDGIVGKSNADIGTGTVGGGEGLGIGVNGTGSSNEIYETAGVEIYPEFPGGMNAWAKYIQKNLRYPNMAQEEGVQGKVFLSFVVEKDGTITDVKVIKGIGYGCDDEAIRVIKKSPRWKAGMQNNLPVRVRYSMPISYIMSN